MFYSLEHKIAYIFDPCNYIGLKRRGRMNDSSLGSNQEHNFSKLSLFKLSPYYSKNLGKPYNRLHVAFGTLSPRRNHSVTYANAELQFLSNLELHYAVNIVGESANSKSLGAKILNLITHGEVDSVDEIDAVGSEIFLARRKK